VAVIPKSWIDAPLLQLRTVRWIPNLLTGARIALLPVFLYLLTRVPVDGPAPAAWSPERWWAMGLLLIMGLTDYLDGWAARRLDAVSRIGGIVDAAADRLALLLPLLFFTFASPAAFSPVALWVPAWLVGVDVATGAAWLGARQRRGVRAPLSHNMPGRVATWIFFALLLWILAGWLAAGVVALAVVALTLSTVSSALYVRRWWGG
jgi:cardiolipin synthase (CMP-forming)